MHRTSLIVLICLATARAGASESWEYLGKPPPGEEREVFLAGVSERIAISADGREIFCDDNGGVSVHRYADGAWQAPAAVATAGLGPGLSPDGTTLWVENPRGQILAAHKAGAAWPAPEVWLSQPERLHYYQETASGAAYVTRMGGSGIQGTICRAQKAGAALQLDPLPAAINSGDNGVDFFIARDESYLIFVVHPGGKNGDLNIAFRRPDGTWTAPVNLGPKVNRDTTWEWGPSVSPDGRYLFVTAASSAKDVAVYWIRIDGIIERLRVAALAQ